MTVVSRGARSRRGGRRPGWTLATALLVLAIAASSALVFTNRTELLKLAIILALWAAVLAAFISVIYRRQSDVEQAKARDLKLVYDLQLDREIAARREYELEVEASLRRELTAELQAQAADEVAALRAELAALRTNLEILFETELDHRPALETERTTVRAYSDWDRDDARTDPGRAPRGRFTASARGDVDVGAVEEDHIIDVREEPPEPEQPLAWPPPAEEPMSRRPSGLYIPPGYGGVHRRPSEEGGRPGRPSAEPEQQPPDGPVFRPEPQPVFQPAPPPEPAAGDDWEPLPAEGQWLPPGTPGSNWVSSSNGFAPPDSEPAPPVSAEARGGRHSSAAEPSAAAPPPPAPAPPQPVPAPGPPDYGVAASGRRSRHSADAANAESYVTPSTATPFPTPPPAAPTAAPGPSPRHRTAEAAADDSEVAQGQGQSVAELLARLRQGAPTEGGRRRRRDD